MTKAEAELNRRSERTAIFMECGKWAVERQNLEARLKYVCQQLTEAVQRLTLMQVEESK